MVAALQACCLAACLGVSAARPDASVPLYKQRGAPINQRVDDLLSRMTIEEKITQTYAPYGGNPMTVVDKFINTSVGELAFTICPDTFEDGTGTLSGPAARLAWRNKIQHLIVENSRLGIPVSFSNEALHSSVAGGTVFPEPVSQGTTWDPELVEEIASAIATEARSMGINLAFSPVINMWVDSRFGRLQEGFSENPTLTSAYARAAAKGFQGDQPMGEWAYFNASKVVALAKHYAAYGAAAGGLNGGPAEMSERTLREFYLKPWKAFAAAGGKGAMTAHNTVLNQPCHANPYLVNDIFRKEFGFGDGIIISDCNDIPALISFRVAADMPHAAAKGILGGVDWDLQCGSQSAYTNLSNALAAGLVNESVIETSARRSLMLKFAVGLFDNPYTPANGYTTLNSLQNQQLALRAAEEGVVLLKNDRNVLPLSSSTGLKIAVVGPNGGGTDAQANYLGSYTQWNASTVKVLTVYDALAAHFAKTDATASVQFSPGAAISSYDISLIPAAVELAKSSDVTVVVVGDDLSSSSEWGDRDSLDLPGSQLPLLAAVVNLSTPCIVVHIGGRTATFGPNNALLDQVDAFMAAFRPGQMGGVAIANLITGITSPSGKLAQNWIRSAGQSMSGAGPWLQWRVGKWVANTRGTPDPDGRYYDAYKSGFTSAQDGSTVRSDPLFRFGQGLTYTNFTFTNLLATTTGNPQSPARATVTVKNVGARSGTVVVQIYAEDPVMDHVRPWKRLIAFQRVTLAAGEAQPISLDLTADELEFYDDDMKLRIVPGTYTISAGEDSFNAGYLTTSLVL